MKKFMFSLLIATFVVLSSSISYAANWQWINSTDEIGYFFDTETIHYGLSKSGIDKTKIVCWEKQVYTQKGADGLADSTKDSSLHDLDYSIDLKIYSIPDRSFILHSMIGYDHNGKILYDYTYDRFFLIIPDSNAEYIFETILDYARLHHDELIEHTHGD